MQSLEFFIEFQDYIKDKMKSSQLYSMDKRGMLTKRKAYKRKSRLLPKMRRNKFSSKHEQYNKMNVKLKCYSNTI